jgi:hypothetical protein
MGFNYNLQLHVKAEGCDLYPVVATPNPLYTGQEAYPVLTDCMGWNFARMVDVGEGKYKTCYYRCDDVLPKIEQGLKELNYNREKYEKYEYLIGAGIIRSSLDILMNIACCIDEQAKTIPLKSLYLSW